MKMQSLAQQSTGSLPGPHDITRKQISNGIVVLSRPNYYSQSVSLAGYLQAGSLYDPEEKLGLADFCATTLMRGTAGASFQELYERLESIGASLGFSSGAHTAGFGGKALADDLSILLDTLAEVILNPSFPEADLERVRSQLLTGLDLRAQDTGEMASLGFDQIAYSGHPYRFPSDGYLKTIQAITRQDIRDFHRGHYGPAGMVLVVVGPVEGQDVVELIESRLGSWKNTSQAPVIEVPDAQTLKEEIQQHTAIKDKSQADIVLGAAGPRRSEAGFYPALLGNSILGQFGLMGRIGESVRINAGLAYYAYSSLGSSLGPGPWTVAAGVDPRNLDQAIQLIKTEISRFCTEPVSSEELKDVQANYIGKLPLSLESNRGIAGALLNIERHDLGLDYLQKYQSMVRSITPEMILEAARAYLDPGKLAISTAGPEL